MCRMTSVYKNVRSEVPTLFLELDLGGRKSVNILLLSMSSFLFTDRQTNMLKSILGEASLSAAY